MADSKASPIKSPTGTGGESPTTVRPLDMSDDDDVPETATLGHDAPSAPTSEAQAKPASEDQPPPPKPPRPVSPQQQAENTLKEAFPSIDAAVVKAVLIASGGRIEPAFNALLGMSDPDAAKEVPPPQPPRPANAPQGSTPLSQVEADELYARQLAEQYDIRYQGSSRGSSREQARPRQAQGTRGTGLKPNELRDEEYSFLDDDLPVIKENLRKGFLETQNKFNGWIKDLKKKIEGDDTEEDRQGSSSAQGSQRRSGDVGRASGDYGRYDADPQVLGDDFAGMHFNSDGTPARRSTRPLANPDLFKPTPAIPKTSSEVEGPRKVSFQERPIDIADNSSNEIYRASPKAAAVLGKEAPLSSSATKQSKWQPLSTVDPSPIGEAENDPFSLGDSEDEKESKDRVGGKEIKMEDTERLKKKAEEAAPAELSRKPEPAETVGTKDKIVQELIDKA